MIGIPARSTLVDAQQFAKEFVPYGTPCDELRNRGAQKLEVLQCEVEQLRAQIQQLIEERDSVQGDAKKRDRA